MTVNYVEIYAWYADYHKKALETGNEEKQQLMNIKHMLRDVTADKAFDLCETAKNLATRLNEPFWYFLFEVEVYRNQDDLRIDPKTRLDNALKLFVEANKPRYKGCPIMVVPYMILIMAYRDYDLIGYSKEILDAIQYCLDNLPMNYPIHRNFLGDRTTTYIALEEWDKAKASCEDWIKNAGSHHYDSVWSALNMCHICYKTGDRERLAMSIDLALANIDDKHNPIVEFTALCWRGVLLTYDKLSDSESVSLNTKIDTLYNRQDIVARPASAFAEFYYSLERKFIEEPRIIKGLMYSPIQRNDSRAQMALCTYYRYQNSKGTAKYIEIFGYALDKLDSQSPLRKILISLKTPLGFSLGQHESANNIAIRLIWSVILVPIILLYALPVVLTGIILRAFMNPEHDLKKYIQTLLKDSPSLPIFEERLNRIDNDENYIP